MVQEGHHIIGAGVLVVCLHGASSLALLCVRVYSYGQLKRLTVTTPRCHLSQLLDLCRQNCIELCSLRCTLLCRLPHAYWCLLRIREGPSRPTHTAWSIRALELPWFPSSYSQKICRYGCRRCSCRKDVLPLRVRLNLVLESCGQSQGAFGPTVWIPPDVQDAFGAEFKALRGDADVSEEGQEGKDVSTQPQELEKNTEHGFWTATPIWSSESASSGDSVATLCGSGHVWGIVMDLLCLFRWLCQLGSPAAQARLHRLS